MISIHAPPWGERLNRRLHFRQIYDFNPRSPVGGATFTGTVTFAIFDISIHAPPWGERRCAQFVI